MIPSARQKTLHSDPPVITYGTSDPANTRQLYPTSDVVQPVGIAPGSINTTYDRIDHNGFNGYAGFEAEFTGDVISLAWRCQAAGAERVMVFVDGHPCMSDWETPSVSTTPNNTTYYRAILTFADFKKRKVEILVTNTNAFLNICISKTGSISPTPRKPTILIIGDSFLGLTAGLSNASKQIACRLATMYDASFASSGQGGTGYATAGSFFKFGDASRVTLAESLQPDKIVFMGSVNDDGKSTIQSEATATLAAYKEASPASEIIVLGPQPNGYSVTCGATRSANIAAVKAAALANGVTFYDMIGTADGVPADFVATSQTYNDGDLCVRYGSVWRHTYPTPSTYAAGSGPGNSKHWELVTYDYYGTGRVGNLVGDGSRDVMLYSDGTHPTDIGCEAFAARIANAVFR